MSDQTIDMRDVEVVAETYRAMLEEKWVSFLVPEAEIQRFSMAVVRNLNDARAERK